MSNGVIQNNGGGYAPKMDSYLTKAIEEWWKGLTKDEILDYLREQPTVTADILRNMLANENCKLSFGVSFSAATHQSVTDFYRDRE